MPFGASKPHERVLCFALQDDAPLGTLEGEVGTDDAIGITQHFAYFVLTFFILLSAKTLIKRINP